MEGDFSTDSVQPQLPMTLPAQAPAQPIDLLVPKSDLHTDVLDRLIEAERGIEVLKAIEKLRSPRDQAVLRIHWGETIVPIRISAPYQPG